MGRKLNFMDWVLTQRFRHSKGNCEIDFLKNFMVYFLGAQVYINAYLKWEVPWYFIIIGMLGYMVLSWIVGYIWDYYKLYHVEAEIGNRRNPFVKEIREKFHFKEK